MKNMFQVIAFLLFLPCVIMADGVKSTNGTINFDVQSDAQTEMILNATGLGIGISPASNLHVNGNAVIINTLKVGNGTSTSNLNINGSMGYQIQTVSSNSTLSDASMVFVDSSSDNITLMLPYAGNVTGRICEIKKISSLNSVWVSGGGNLIDDTSPIELPPLNNLASVKLFSDGSQWYKLSEADSSETVAADNLVGWWKLDETTGTMAADSSGQNNHGTLTKNTFSSNSQTGKLVNALYFHGDNDSNSDGNADGNGGYITVNDSSSLDISTSITMSIWYKMDAFDHTYPTIMAKSNQNYRFYFAEGNKKFRTRMVYTGAGTTDLVSSFASSTGVWYHAVFTYDGKVSKIFMNGDLDVSSNLVDTIVTNNNDLIIGDFGAGSIRPFQGTIDDFRIYNRALTAAEVKAMYDRGQQ